MDGPVKCPTCGQTVRILAEELRTIRQRLGAQLGYGAAALPRTLFAWWCGVKDRAMGDYLSGRRRVPPGVDERARKLVARAEAGRLKLPVRAAERQRNDAARRAKFNHRETTC